MNHSTSRNFSSAMLALALTGLMAGQPLFAQLVKINVQVPAAGTTAAAAVTGKGVAVPVQAPAAGMVAAPAASVQAAPAPADAVKSAMPALPEAAPAKSQTKANKDSDKPAAAKGKASVNDNDVDATENADKLPPESARKQLIMTVQALIHQGKIDPEDLDEQMLMYLATPAQRRVMKAMAKDQPEHPEVRLSWIKERLAKAKKDGDSTNQLRDVSQWTGFKYAALNHDIIAKHNNHYTTELASMKRTDQRQSGRCWIFGATNAIRDQLIAQGKVPKDFEFSQNYLYFVHMLEQANLTLEKVITKAYTLPTALLSERDMEVTAGFGVEDGGWYEHFQFLVNKYGLVPKSAMGETLSSMATSTLNDELSRSMVATANELLADVQRVKQRKSTKVHAAEIKERGMNQMMKILTTHLGKLPMKFTYTSWEKKRREGSKWVTPVKQKEYTPQEFARDFAGYQPHDYIKIGSDPRRKYGVVYEAPDSSQGVPKGKDSVFNVRYLNVNPQTLMELAAAAIEKGIPVPFAANVSKDVDYGTGIMHPGIYNKRDAVYKFSKDEKLSRISRSKALDFFLEAPNHEMLFTGVDRDPKTGKIIKLKVENSWGTDVGNKGIFASYAEWFLQNVYEITIPMSQLSPAQMKLWKGPAVPIDEQNAI